VPGQVQYGSTRKIVLNGVDGIVFVADSQREVMEANLDTLLDLEKHLIATGKTLEDFPWVLQYNKRDLPGAETVEEMQKKLNFFGVPSFEAVALTGQGVFPTLKAVIKKVVGNVHAQLEGTQRMRA
jgi:signal recognition particle receptor subunit beta